MKKVLMLAMLSCVPALAQEETPPKNDLLSKLKISGYLQGQYVNDDAARDQFSVRRGRLKFTYQATPTARLVLQPDISSSGVTLRDGYVELIEPWTSWKHTLTAGQFSWPFGFEIGYSSSQRELPERSRVIRTLFPGERDRGVMLSGRGMQDRFSYKVAVVNGNGTTASADTNDRKDVLGRVGYEFGPLGVGASVYRGSDLVDGRELDKERQGVDVQWTTPLPGLAVRGEYISGKQTGADVDGWYFYAIQNIGTRHQLAARIDEYDPNTEAGDDATRTLGGSYIFHWDKHSKVMLAYERPRREGNDPGDNVLTVRYQYAF
ncbi:MAG TPA: porin [Thermoanaerobaculia bacterium]|nr:porin [Thermoanaerobaculia bacterium]